MKFKVNKEHLYKGFYLSLLVIASILIIILLSNVNQLQSRIDNLKRKIDSLQQTIGDLEDQFQNALNQLEKELEEQSRSFFNVTTMVKDFQNSTLTVEVNFTLKEYYKNSNISVVATNLKTNQNVTSSATNLIGNNFKTELQLAYSQMINPRYMVSYVIENDDLIKSELMTTLDFNEILKNRFQCKAMARFSHNNDSGAVYIANIFIYNEHLGTEKLKIKTVELLIGDESFDMTYQGELTVYTSQLKGNEEKVIKLKVVDNLGFTYYF